MVKFGTFMWGYFKFDLGYELKFNLKYGQAQATAEIIVYFNENSAANNWKLNI